jgi:hypothetical protein
MLGRHQAGQRGRAVLFGRLFVLKVARAWLGHQPKVALLVGPYTKNQVQLCKDGLKLCLYVLLQKVAAPCFANSLHQQHVYPLCNACQEGTQEPTAGAQVCLLAMLSMCTL